MTAAENPPFLPGEPRGPSRAPRHARLADGVADVRGTMGVPDPVALAAARAAYAGVRRAYWDATLYPLRAGAPPAVAARQRARRAALVALWAFCDAVDALGVHAAHAASPAAHQAAA